MLFITIVKLTSPLLLMTVQVYINIVKQFISILKNCAKIQGQGHTNSRILKANKDAIQISYNSSYSSIYIYLQYASSTSTN